MTSADEFDTGLAQPLIAEPQGKPYEETREFGLWTVLGVLAAGAALGAAAAVLLAPDSGAGTRRRLSKTVRRLTRRERGTWERLRRTLDEAVEDRRARKRAERLSAEGS
jgi:uncharacterized membrane protein YccC